MTNYLAVTFVICALSMSSSPSIAAVENSDIDARCESFGFKRGTTEHRDCTEQYQKSTGRPSKSTPEQREDKFWEDAVATGNASAFEAYISAYPAGHYVGLARAHLSRLNAPLAIATPVASPFSDSAASKGVTPSEQRREDQFWRDTMNAHTAEAYRAYISAYPNGLYLSLAKAYLTSLAAATPADASVPKSVIFSCAPVAPIKSLPNGFTATLAQMLDAQREVKRFQAEIAAYRTCIDSENPPSPSGTLMSAEKKSLQNAREMRRAQLHNEAVAMEEAVASQFNVQLHAYKTVRGIR
jgi:hypothetical protein